MDSEANQILSEARIRCKEVLENKREIIESLAQ